MESLHRLDTNFTLFFAYFFNIFRSCLKSQKYWHKEHIIIIWMWYENFLSFLQCTVTTVTTTVLLLASLTPVQTLHQICLGSTKSSTDFTSCNLTSNHVTWLHMLYNYRSTNCTSADQVHIKLIKFWERVHLYYFV